MEVSEVVGYIGTVGFPIVCCLILFYLVEKKLSAVTEALNSNTVVMQRLLDKLGGMTNVTLKD